MKMFRLNKCLPMASRRAADQLIQSGSVSINNNVAKLGDQISYGDVIRIDGKLIEWEKLMHSKTEFSMDSLKKFHYIKYWKPVGQTCTTAAQDPSNIIDQGGFRSLSQRIFPVGRLDKDSSGLILLTSDTRLDKAFLNPKSFSRKVYQVSFTTKITDHQIHQLSQGVDIPIEIKRESSLVHSLVVRTSPCEIKRTKRFPDMSIELTLTEGKNRQIRKMAEVVDLKVASLHRVEFCSLTIDNLTHPGDWKYLDEDELKIIQNALQSTLP